MEFNEIALTSLGSGVVSVVLIAIKQWNDKRIELQKARLGRASWIHQRQVEILSKLYRHLTDMQDDLKNATRAGRLTNELPPEGYVKAFFDDLALARSEFIDGKLLLPVEIVAACEELFREFWNAQLAIGIAWNLIQIGDGAGHAQNWTKAQEIAHQFIPDLLKGIDASARRVIHEESKKIA